MIVADTNLIAYLLVQGERSALAEQVLEKDPHWIAPILWRSELRQVLLKTVRAGLSATRARELMTHAEDFLYGREFTVPSGDVLNLGFASPCSAYDCEFVALALSKDVPLVTSDRRLRRAFPDVAVDPESFVQG